MDDKHLFQDEKIITKSDKDLITLTTHRVRYNASEIGTSHIISIMLEKISSIEIHYKSNFIILLIGIIVGFCGIIMSYNSNDTSVAIAGLVIGGLFVLYFFKSRKHVITISSDGGSKINFFTEGMNREAVLDFINKIEIAKESRSKLIK